MKNQDNQTWTEDKPGRCANCGYPLYYTLQQGRWVFFTGDTAKKRITRCPQCHQEIDYEDTLPGHSDED